MRCADPVRRRFLRQRQAAHSRDLDFYFTFEEWVVWWEINLGPDWFKKRGRITGKYVMARNEDSGPYEPANVHCALFDDHSKEQKQNKRTTFGERHVNCKLKTEQAVSIKHDVVLSLDQLAEKFGVSRRTVRDIREGRRWKHLPSPS